MVESNTQHTGLKEQAGMPIFDGTHYAFAIIALKWLMITYSSHVAQHKCYCEHSH